MRDWKLELRKHMLWNMSHIHWGTRQNKLEVPRDKKEVNNREIHECDGRPHDPDTMVSPLTPKPTLYMSKEFIMNQENESYGQDLYMSVGVMKD